MEDNSKNEESEETPTMAQNDHQLSLPGAARGSLSTRPTKQAMNATFRALYTSFSGDVQPMIQKRPRDTDSPVQSVIDK